MKTMIMIAPFPPPVTGQTNSSAGLSEVFKEHFDVRKCNIVRGNSRHKLISYSIRTLRVFKAAKYIFFKAKETTTVYISVDANRGMIITLLLGLIAQYRKSSIIFHHHSFSHISKTSRLMKAIESKVKARTTHVVICDIMGHALKEKYPEISDPMPLSNIFLLEDSEASKATKQQGEGQLKMGYMSQITREKGIFEALDLLKQLVKSDEGSKLLVGGTFKTESQRDECKKYIEEQNLQDNVEFLGFLDSSGKKDFFKEIDVFLFPTKYKNETQGIVNLEALQHDVPVVAYGRCCITQDINAVAGLVVPLDQKYAVMASEFLQNPKSLSQLSPKSRFKELLAENEIEIRKIIRIC